MISELFEALVDVSFVDVWRLLVGERAAAPRGTR